MQQVDTGTLPDGTPFVRWHPAPALSDRWFSAIEPRAQAVLDRWHARRLQLQGSGRWDHFVASLIESWQASGWLPRPIDTADRSGEEILLDLAFDASIAVSVKHGVDPKDRFPSLSARAQATELLYTAVLNQGNISAPELKRLHRLICIPFKSNALGGMADHEFERTARGKLRPYIAFIVDADGLMKEGCPPDRLRQELYSAIAVWAGARESGSNGPAMAAWLLGSIGLIHPFLDGNGRLGRMLASFELVRSGLFPLLIPPDGHQDFLRAAAKIHLGECAPLVRLITSRQCEVLSAALTDRL